MVFYFQLFQCSAQYVYSIVSKSRKTLANYSFFVFNGRYLVYNSEDEYLFVSDCSIRTFG